MADRVNVERAKEHGWDALIKRLSLEASYQ
jgi:hypothetical protein